MAIKEDTMSGIIFIAIMWVCYGLLTYYHYKLHEEHDMFILCVFIFLAPLVLIVRIYYGVFTDELFKSKKKQKK